jgi:hypothetical protein
MNNFEGLRSKKTESEKKAKLDEGKDYFSVRLNDDERKMLDDAKRILAVDRDSTALKELAELGYNVIHGFLLGKIIRKVLKRLRRGYADTSDYYNKDNGKL